VEVEEVGQLIGQEQPGAVTGLSQGKLDMLTDIDPN